MPKTYVLDTNVLLHNPQAIFVFQDNHVVIPLAVIEEIDDQKRRQDEIGRHAREVSRLLDNLRGQGPLAHGVKLPSGGTLRIEINHREMEDLPEELEYLDSAKPDNRILAVALNLSNHNGNGQVTLISKDMNLRLKADVLGIRAEDLTSDKVDFRKLYSGQVKVIVPAQDLDRFFAEKRLPLPDQAEIMPNQLVVLRCDASPSASALARLVDGWLEPLVIQDSSKCFGLRPRNKEQLFALELLLDPRVKVVTLAGGAGTGKTLLALAAGLDLVLEQNQFGKLLITRPIIPLEGQDLGFLPGDKYEKIRPWMQPIYDNLQFLFHNSGTVGGSRMRGQKHLFKSSEPPPAIEDYLSLTGQMEMEALTFIRGRSIPNQFILVDEAQNCSAHAIKTMLTRVGENSKIVFTGDIGQIDHPYLDAASNGFTLLVEKLKGSPLSGHMTLLKGERSDIAELGARLL
ncbi:MAG: PhoH family protein [Desulfarculaceae bacterium]|jgi:PhoH-like ATPase